MSDFSQFVFQHWVGKYFLSSVNCNGPQLQIAASLYMMWYQRKISFRQYSPNPLLKSGPALQLLAAGHRSALFVTIIGKLAGKHLTIQFENAGQKVNFKICLWRPSTGSLADRAQNQIWNSKSFVITSFKWVTNISMFASAQLLERKKNHSWSPCKSMK